MKRTELANILKQVEPGVSSKDFIRILSCLCFDGQFVTTYDDVVAMQVPCSLPLKGAVKGKLLISWLNASKATEVNLAQTDNDIVITAGRSELKTAVYPPEEFIFNFPDATGAIEVPVVPEIIEGFRTAMLSMGHDPGHPWRLGMTVHFRKNSTVLYTSDDKTATKVRLPVKVNEEMVGRVTILPPKFCALVVDAAAKDEFIVLLLSEDWVEAKFKSGLRIFSLTRGGASVETYEGSFSQVENAELQTFPVPAGLGRCLSRALVLIPFAQKPYTLLTVSENKLKFKTESAAGIAHDGLAFEGHPDLTIRVSPELMTKALDRTIEMALIKDTCIVYRGENFTHLISDVKD